MKKNPVDIVLPDIDWICARPDSSNLKLFLLSLDATCESLKSSSIEAWVFKRIVASHRWFLSLFTLISSTWDTSNGSRDSRLNDRWREMTELMNFLVMASTGNLFQLLNYCPSRPLSSLNARTQYKCLKASHFAFGLAAGVIRVTPKLIMKSSKGTNCHSRPPGVM